MYNVAMQLGLATERGTSQPPLLQLICCADPCEVNSMITQQELRSLLHYDPETGIFTNLVTRGGAKKGTSTSSVLSSTGYRRISFAARAYFAHRLAWLYTHGVWPTEIDHINQNRADNRLVNLREVTRAENGRNQKYRSTCRSGCMGVSAVRGKWRARIRFNGAYQHLGYFDDYEDAVAVRKAAEAVHGYHPNHGRST